MARTKVIFEYFKIIFGSNIKINYVETIDLLDEDILKLRSKREYESKISFQENIVNKINTVEEFINWFYTKHNAYRALI